jgi:hypothetical protein
MPRGSTEVLLVTRKRAGREFRCWFIKFGNQTCPFRGTLSCVRMVMTPSEIGQWAMGIRSCAYNTCCPKTDPTNMCAVGLHPLFPIYPSYGVLKERGLCDWAKITGVSPYTRMEMQPTHIWCGISTSATWQFPIPPGQAVTCGHGILKSCRVAVQHVHFDGVLASKVDDFNKGAVSLGICDDGAENIRQSDDPDWLGAIVHDVQTVQAIPHHLLQHLHGYADVRPCHGLIRPR